MLKFQHNFYFVMPVNNEQPLYLLRGETLLIDRFPAAHRIRITQKLTAAGKRRKSFS